MVKCSTAVFENYVTWLFLVGQTTRMLGLIVNHLSIFVNPILLIFRPSNVLSPREGAAVN